MRVAIDKNHDGIIDNVIVAETLELAQELFPNDDLFEVSNGVGIGWVKQEDGSYAAPPEIVPEIVVSQADFKRLMTSAERIAIREASEQSPAIFDFMDLLNSSVTVHLSHPDVIAGITALEIAGILSPERRDEILSGEQPAN